MLIECPACHTRAKLPDTQAGAKVRCGECGRAYVAHAPYATGRPGARSRATTGLILALSVGTVALISLGIVASRGEPEPSAREPLAATEEPEPLAPPSADTHEAEKPEQDQD